MEQLGPKSYYDVVVIGAGVGGLTAAALLSKVGFSVCVLEKEQHVGGYLAGFRRKDFRFDSAIHWLNQCSPEGLVGKVFDILGSDHPVAVPQTRIRRYLGEDFDYLLTSKPDDWKDQLIREFGHEKQGIERFFQAAKRLGYSFQHFQNIFRSEETMSLLERARNKVRLLKFGWPFIPYLRYSGENGLRRGLKRFFHDEMIQRIFLAESDLLSCLVPIGWAYYGDFQSPPPGGSQVIPDWLHYVLRYFGSELWTRYEVKQILLENERCAGVVCESRSRSFQIKSKYVVAACDVEALYERMLPSAWVPEKLKKRLREADLYSSSVTVSIALNCPVEVLGFNEEMIHLASVRTSVGKDLIGNPETSEISILAPTFRDKTLAPEGQGTLTLYMPALMDYEDLWRTQKDDKGNLIRGEAYQQLKIKIAEILIRRVEQKLAIQIKPHILFYEVATPVTHWRYTGNRNGSIMGARPGRRNMQHKIAHYQTPVPHLLLGGHWAELGGGVPIAVKAGTNAALMILKKENPVAFRALSQYMDNRISLETLQGLSCFGTYDNSYLQPFTPAQKLAQRSRSPRESS